MTTAEISEAVRFVALAAREIRDRQICFVGIGVPSLAAIVAKRLHAPDSVLIYESGAIDAIPPVPPLSTGSPSVTADTAMVASCLDVFSMLQRGTFDVGLLSGAQIDRYGNLNSTVLGSYEKPRTRLVGSGGAHDIAVLARELILMMPHDPRRFVEKVDFVTSPGLRPDDGRRRGGGPKMLITPRARFTFEQGELTLAALAPGVNRNEAVEGFPWKVPAAATLDSLPPIEPEFAALCAELLAAWSRGTD